MWNGIRMAVLGGIFLAGCGSPATAPDPQPLVQAEPPTSAAKDSPPEGQPLTATTATDPRTDATATAQLFLVHLNAGESDAAFALMALSEKMPKPFIDGERKQLDRISADMKAGTWHMSFVEIHTDGVGAVAVVNEDIKKGKPAFDLDPLFLVHLNGQWSIVPGLTQPKNASTLLTETEFTAFKNLAPWYDAREKELKAIHLSAPHEK